MIYTTFASNGQKVSSLGLGCMRFTKKGTQIDQEKAEREMLLAIKSGINYFDTAYIYPGNEVCLGKFFTKGHREQVLLATKLPHYKVKTLEDAKNILAEELERLQTDYIDYYLMHMLPEAATWERMVSIGVAAWLEELKEAGTIRNLGFSYHGGTPNFKGLIDAYPWDFCQIQYNYLDEYAQAGVAGLKYAYEKEIPVVIMEPLKGGKLTHALPSEAKKLLHQAHPDWSPAEWALRWLWAQEEVAVVLSGMNDVSQVEENVRIATLPRENLLTDADYAVLGQVVKLINEKAKVSCTGCGYCMPCPAGVDIPVCFRAYNNRYLEGWFSGLKDYFMNTTLKPNPTIASNCTGCGKCEPLCPQAIPIRAELRRVKRKMETPIFKVAKWGSKFYGRF